MGTVEDFIGSNKVDEEMLKKFWEEVDKRSDDECWLWTGKKRGGYGIFKYKGWSVLVHRFAYFLANGNISGDFFVHQKCNNKLCINHNHLEMTSKARHMKGSWWNKGKEMRK